MPMDSDDSRQTSGFAPHAEPPQRRLEILHQRTVWPAQRRRPRDHHIVMPRPGMLRHNRSDRRAQAPTCTISLDRAADTPARGESHARRGGITGLFLPTCLKNESGSHVFPAFGSNSQEFRPTGQSTDGRAHGVRLRGACGPSCVAGRESAGPPSWPYASESRGAACVRASPVDRCVSRLSLRSPVEFERRCIEAGWRRVNLGISPAGAAHRIFTGR